jgi:hypothetical protein
VHLSRKYGRLGQEQGYALGEANPMDTAELTAVVLSPETRLSTNCRLAPPPFS